MSVRAFIDPPPSVPVIPHGSEVHPGFGRVALCKNGVEVAHDVEGERGIDWYTKRIDSEGHAHSATPVWTLHIDAPFTSQVYAFTSDRQWTLIDTKDGFA